MKRLVKSAVCYYQTIWAQMLHYIWFLCNGIEWVMDIWQKDILNPSDVPPATPHREAASRGAVREEATVRAAAAVRPWRRGAGAQHKTRQMKNLNNSSFLFSSLTKWKRRSGFFSPHITKITIFLVFIYIICIIEVLYFYKILKPGTAGVPTAQEERFTDGMGPADRQLWGVWIQL